MTTEHMPDSSRLPAIGHWLPMDLERGWEDGTQLLVAVPIDSKPKWIYELNVVTIKCDEHFFELKCNDEPWGWTMEDVDFFIVLSGGAE